MALSEAARSLWAKSDKGGGWHPLLAHLLDVAACAEAILEREPKRTLELYAEDLQLPPNEARAWVYALAGLHDIGKASPAFQQKWEEGKQRVWAAGLGWSKHPTPPPKDIAHNVISEYVLPDMLEGFGWHCRAAGHVATAVGEHHGFRATRVELDAVLEKERGDARWDEVRQELFEAVLEVLDIALAPQVALYGGAAFERLAGLTSFADWIGSSLDFHPLGHDLNAYYQGAKQRAVQKLDSIGWFMRETLMPEAKPLAEVFSYLSDDFQPRPLQETLERMLEGANRPALFLVEAPMGEGKTEAALYAHLRLQAANKHRGFYIALPTQATGNLMFERVKHFLEQFGKGRKLDLQLLHGASELVATYQDIRVNPNTPEQSYEGVEAQTWFSHRKRAMLSEYGVGTVDQALLGILPSKHQFVRLWGLGNRVVVLDEVHAYDTYTSVLIETLVRWLAALDSSVILMSATLPNAKRKALLSAFGAAEVTQETDKGYPRITRVFKGDPQPTVETFRARKQPTLTIKAISLDLDALAREVINQAKRGGCVACIVNTVQRAQELYQKLGNNPEGVEVYLFHARYPLDERLKRERTVLEKFGKEGERPQKAILVATQVVEQSLDLDFDVMFSDLAPVDLLLQRSGRLHRHARQSQERHAHTTPVLWVAGLDAEGVPDFGVAERIYERYVLLRSWLVLKERAQIALPADIDTLVQEVYSFPEPRELTRDWQEAFRQSLDAMTKRNDKAADEAAYAPFGLPEESRWLEPKDFPKLPDDEPNPDDDPSLLHTRKGSPSATVVLLYRMGGRVYLDEAGTEPVCFAAKLNLEEAKRLFARSVKLSRFELIQNHFETLDFHRQAQGIPTEAWRKTTLLAHAYPVVLEEGKATLGKLELELHPQLGVVYRSAL
jgi:CRISPR-associated endonuclease/helicase Cas3